MGQREKVLGMWAQSSPDYLTSISNIHVKMKREDYSQNVVFWPIQECYIICMCMCVHTPITNKHDK